MGSDLRQFFEQMMGKMESKFGGTIGAKLGNGSAGLKMKTVDTTVIGNMGLLSCLLNILISLLD